MAAMPGRFEVEDGEIIDTKARQIISLDQFSKLATPEEQASVRQQIQDSGWAGADQTDEADSSMMARGTVTRPGATETPSPQEALPSRPSLQQFMEVAKQDNPDVPDRDLRRYWAQNYSDIDPKTLPSLETFMTAAKEDNPGVPEQALKAYWEENYGDFGAAEKDTHLGLTGTLWQGAKSAGRSLKATGQAIIGDEAGVVDTADAQQSAPRDIALQNLLADIQKRKDALGKDPSWLSTIGEVGKAALSNPKGAGLLLAEQLPNSAIALGSGLAGAAAGSALGPLGTIAGGIAGLFVANTALETGGKVIEAGADQFFTPEERSRTLKEGLTKGAVITGVDAAALGLTNFITGTTARAVERATVKTLTDAGVDVTDRAAVMAATKNPDIFSAVQSAQQRAQIAANTLGQRLARGGGAIGAEAIGEGAGEYLGEYAATGEADKMEAVIEAFAGLGQSAGEITFTQMRNRGRQDQSLITGQTPPAPLPSTTTPTPTAAIPDKLGVGDPSVGVDESIATAWELLNEDTEAQERNAKAAEDQTEQQVINQLARQRPIPTSQLLVDLPDTLSTQQPQPPTLIKKPSDPLDSYNPTVRPPLPLPNAEADEMARSGRIVEPQGRAEPPALEDRLPSNLAIKQATPRLIKKPIVAPTPPPNYLAPEADALSKLRPSTGEVLNNPTVPVVDLTAKEAKQSVPDTLSVRAGDKPILTKKERIAEERQRLLAMRITPSPSRPGPSASQQPVSASPPTEGTTTTPPQTEAATDTPVDAAAHEAAASPQNDRPEPTEAQKEAGNYRKGHLKISGLDISVENPQGSTRSGTDTNGKPWSVTMQHHYGYFRGADFKGKDKEHIDVFVNPGTPEDYSGPVFVIDQKDPQTGRFDEHKTILGTSSADEARAIYQANYAKDWKGFRSIKQFTMPEFKLWLKAGNKQKPVGVARPEKRSAEPSFSLTAQEVAPEKPKSENKQTSIDIPPETIGSRPIIGREVTPEEAPLFSKAAQEPEEKQTDLTDGLSAFDNQAPYEQRPNEPAARNRALAREALAGLDAIVSEPDARGAFGNDRRPRTHRPEAERLAGLERAGIRTPAVAISKDLATKGRVDLRGYAVTSMADLATLAQVFRNPRVETMRFFYVKNGEIVAHEGVSSRLPGSSMAFPISAAELESMTAEDRRAKQELMIDDMADRMLRLGADGYYLLHNHPSGVSRPSSADVQLTKRFHESLPGLLGHVIIDSNEYSTIDTAGQVKTERLPEQRDALLEPYRPHPQLGTVVNSSETLASIGKAMQTPQGYVTIVYLSGANSKVRAIQEIPEALFLNTKEVTNFLRGQARAFGAVSTAAYTTNASDEMVQAANELQKNGSLLDMAVSTRTGEVHSLTRYGHYIEKGRLFGQQERLIGGMRVSDNDSGMDYVHNAPDAKPSNKKPGGLLNTAKKNATDDIGLTYNDFPGITTTSEPSSNVPSRSRVTKDLSDAQRAALARVHGTKETWAERLDTFKKTWKRELVQGLFDQYAPILDYSKKGYILSRMAKSGDGTLEALMLYGKPYVDSDGAYRVDYTESSGLQGFSKVLSSLQGEHDRFLEWIAAQRAGRLKSVGLENLYSEADIATLKTLNQGTMPDGSSREAAYLRAMSQLNEWNDAMVKIGVDSGLISEEAREQFKNVPYVPFYRLQEEGLVTGFGKKPGLVNQYAWKKLKGGTAHLNDDLLANLLQNWSHIITASAKNRAAKETLTAAKLAGVAEEIPSGAPGKGHVHYLENGKEVTFTVSDPALMDAVAALHYAGLGSIGKPFTAMKRALSFAVTVNPAYKIRNLIRDSIQAIGTSDLSYNPLKNMRQGAKATRHEAETRAQLLAGGGMMRFGSMLDGNDTTRTRRLIESGVDPETILRDAGAIEKVWKRLIQPAFQAYQEFGDRGEQLNRAALYEQLLSKGMSHQEASFWARDLMDFSMSGKWAGVRILTQIVPFMNARLQGLYKLGRASKQDYRKLATTLGAVALASIGLMLAYQDDEDWKKREDFDRENYWWFKIGSTAFRLPKPFEIGVVGTIAERSVEYLVSREMTGERFAERLAAVVFSQLSMNPTPQLVKPLMDLYANKDAFTGRPIETMGMERLRKEDRYTDRTSETAKFLGSLGLPDPAQLAMGRWNTLSPVQVDSLVRGYFSWLGSTTMTALDYGIRPMLNRGERPDMTLKEAFLVGNFVESLPNNSSRYLTQFYAQATEIEQAYNSYRDALKRGDTEQAASIMDEERDKIGQYKMVEHVKRQESVLNQQIKLIERSQRMSGEEKRARLDELQQRKQRLVERVAERQMVTAP